MNHEYLHRKIVENCDRVHAWFAEKSQGLPFPIYSSFDLRDAGYKMGPVDANIFPAGFNNICVVDRENSADLARRFLEAHYSPETRRVVILTEEHTQNPYYWDNVWTIQTILQAAGREVRLAIPRPLSAPIQVLSASGQTLTVYSAARKDSGLDVGGFTPDLIICNNDFSMEHGEWASDLKTPMNPPHELGWYRRRKDRFFRVYNELVAEFCAVLGVDPWTLQVETELFTGFEVESEESRDRLATRAEELFERLRAKYKERDIRRDPFLFVKNNAGTYGLGVVQVSRPEEIRSWSYKARKKMKAAKGGREITEVIIQEGIPTSMLAEGGKTAEPVIYMIGCQLAGGFLRAHEKKSDAESLNSPGAVFQRLCIADLEVKLEGCPMENAFGWVAKLAFLSIAREARELAVEFRGYRIPSAPQLSTAASR